MKRLYYLTSNIDSAEQISIDLHSRGISDWRFHIISKNEAGLISHRLHSANLFYRTDIIRYGERGAIIGAAMGILFAGSLYFGQSISVVAAMLMVITLTFFGAWVGGLGGISRENYKVKRFHDDIVKGLYLIMVDVSPKEMDLIRAVMADNHPEAVLQGVDQSTWINPFSWSKA